MPPYEPEVIELFAAQLQRRAKSVRRGFAVAGMLLGALFGSFPLTSLGSAWPIPHIFGFATLLLGAAVGAFIGWVVGEGRAAMYRMHAQTTLCQLHAQRTTLAIWRLLQERPDDAFRRTELPRMHAPEAVVEEQRALEVFTEESAVPVLTEESAEVLSEEPVVAVPAAGQAIEVLAEEVSPAEDDALAEPEPESEPEPLPEPEPEPVFAPAARLVPPPATPTLTAVQEPESEPVPAPPESPAPFVPVSAPAPRTAPDLVPVSAPPVEPFVPVSVPEPAPEPTPPPFVPVSVPAPAQAYEPAPAVAARAVPSTLRQASNGVPPLLPPPLSD